jgi:hypothetical protein
LIEFRETAAGWGLLITVVLAALLVAWWSPPLAQDPAYHLFADARPFFGIPSFWNVVSNLAFLAVGLAGLAGLRRGPLLGGLAALRPAYCSFFIGVALIGAGSTYYHLDPSNASLVWDRLAMSIAFMAFFAALVGENLAARLGRWILGPLLVIGPLSVILWYLGELRGQGDLRAYALVQFLPMLLIPLLLIFFRSPFTRNGWVWLTLALYAVSKGAELADAALFETLGFGGHALKHLLAAAGAGCFLIALMRRRPRPPSTADAAP